MHQIMLFSSYPKILGMKYLFLKSCLGLLGGVPKIGQKMKLYHKTDLTFFYRRSLVLELQTTRELLASSLKKVQGLELESRKVPMLETRIQELERNLTDHRHSTPKR